MKNRYITTTLPYVNALPHIGHALELIQADTYARAQRARGERVFFSTGVDEHGQKVYEKAQKEGKDIQAYVDYFASQFQKLRSALNLSNDAFIRTTDSKHIAAAQELWKRCAARGDIYLKKYKGLYCVGDEAFLKEGDLVDGKCPNHPTMDPIIIEEENYFFKLGNYRDQLLTLLSEEGRIVPDWRQKEVTQFITNGLEDISISRDAKRMPWGIPVPGDTTQVMYVWFDALTNYISTLGWPSDTKQFEDFWTTAYTLQFAGKDQTRFQSIIWQAMLLSAELKPTDTVFYHGFINSGGQKMSKSIGNVINPYDMVERYGTDAVRYLLLRHVHPTEDSDVTWEKLDEWYNAHLVNGLGNVTARIMKLAETYLETPVPVEDSALFPDEYTEALDTFQFHTLLDTIWKRIAKLDADITETEPFKKAKTDLSGAQMLLTKQVAQLADIAKLLSAGMPYASTTILTAIRENRKPMNLFPRQS